jgi:hypothetical protein
MTLFLLLICCVGREFIDIVDSTCQLSISIQWRFKGPQRLCFCLPFMDQTWHSGSDNFRRQPWLYFCNRFDASVVNSLTLSIPYGSCHSVFIDDFNVYIDSVFTDDLWISCDIAFFTFPCVNHFSSFAIDWMRRSWNHWCCRFHMLAVTQCSLTISRSTGTMFSLTIYGSAVT